MRELFREVTSMAIYNPDIDKFLVQDRTHTSKYGEEVTFFGGWLDAGETIEQGVQRESYEELWKVFSHYEYLGKVIHDKEWKDYIRHLFFVVSRKEEFHDRECDWAIWLSREEMKRKKFPSDMTEWFARIEKHLHQIKN